MYNIKFQLFITKLLTKPIENKVLDILKGLQEKFSKQNKLFEFKAVAGKEDINFEIKSQDYVATDLLVQFDKKVREDLGRA